MDLKGVRVLVVDDDPAVAECLCEILRNAGADADLVASGNEAMASIRRGGYTLVVSDLYMPGLSGMDVVQSVKTVRPDIPVILMSAGWPKGMPVGVAKAGADGVLVKPFAISQIEEVIMRVLAKAAGGGAPGAAPGGSGTKGTGTGTGRPGGPPPAPPQTGTRKVP